jgi:hypothetical protein
MPKKPAQTAPKAAAADRFNKSAMTNDPLKLEDVDGRTSAGRRLRDLIASLTALVAKDGEPLDDVSAAWVRLAAAGTLRGEQIAAAIGRGEAVKDEDLVRIQNASARTMKELRELKASRDGAKPFNMREHLASLSAAEPDADDDEIESVEFIMPPDDEPHYRPADEPVQPVQAPSAPEPVAVVEPSPAKPVGTLKIVFDPRPRTPIDPIGSTLPQVIGALLAEGYPAATHVTVTTPAETLTGATLADACRARNALPLASRPSWFRR